MTRLLVDGTSITSQCKGVGRYALELCVQLEARLTDNWQIDVLIWNDQIEAASMLKGCRLIRLSPRSELRLGYISIPAYASRLNSDVLLLPGDRAVGWTKIPTISVCHDIDDLIRAAQRSGSDGWRNRLDQVKTKMRIHTLRGSAAVICNSEFVRDRVVSQYRVLRSRTSVAYCAVDKVFYGDPSAAGAKGGYVLVFATGDPRENYVLLPGILAKLKNAGVENGLVIAGVRRQMPYVAELLEKMREYGFKEGVHFSLVDFIDQSRRSELAALYRGADFYLELSAHEGFGMQLAEAMACGTTCISTRYGALGEVGGGYEIPLETVDEGEIASKVCRSYNDRLHLRDNTSQIDYTKKYTWDIVGETVSEVLQVLANPMS